MIDATHLAKRYAALETESEKVADAVGTFVAGLNETHALPLDASPEAASVTFEVIDEPRVLANGAYWVTDIRAVLVVGGDEVVAVTLPLLAIQSTTHDEIVSTFLSPEGVPVVGRAFRDPTFVTDVEGLFQDALEGVIVDVFS